MPKLKEIEMAKAPTPAPKAETKAAPKPEPTEAKETKSVVPAKYAGKYKGGGQGPTSDFIREQCGENDKFEFNAFFDLCAANGIAAEQIANYKGQVDDKVHGAPGRARMTLGNSLRAIARKNQKLVGLDKKEHPVAEPALPQRPKAEAKAA